MTLDPLNQSAQEIYDRPSFRYPLRAQVTAVNEDRGVVDLAFTIGGEWDNVPVTTPIIGAGDWGMFFMPTVDSWVYVILRPNAPPILLPYVADNWEETLKRCTIRKLKQGEIVIRSLNGSEIEMNEDGTTILRNGRLGSIVMDAIRQTISITTGETINGRGSLTTLRLGKRDLTLAEQATLPASAAALAVAPMDGFDISISQLIANIPSEWIRIESGAIDTIPMTNKALRITVKNPTTGIVLFRFSFDAITGNLEVENLKSKFGPINPLGTGIIPGTTLPVAKMGDTVGLSPDLLAWITAVNTAISTLVPAFAGAIPTSAGTVVASATNLETA